MKLRSALYGKLKLFHIHVIFHCKTTLNRNLHFHFAFLPENNSTLISTSWTFPKAETLTSGKLWILKLVSTRCQSSTNVSRRSHNSLLYISKSHLNGVRSWMQIACYFHSVRLEKFKCMHTRERDDRERQAKAKSIMRQTTKQSRKILQGKMKFSAAKWLAIWNLADICDFLC